jgi:hypothetical protein
MTGSATAGSSGTYAGDGPAISFTSGPNVTDGDWSLGWSFTTKTAIDVTALGFYNASLDGGNNTFQNGICGATFGEVGIFNSSGTLLASAQVTSADPVVGFFNYASISTLVLAAGQTYDIIAVTGNADYTGHQRIRGQSRHHFPPNGVLTFPNATEGITAADGGALFGPNFEKTPVSAVPEPTASYCSRR